MSKTPWQAGTQVQSLLEQIKEKNHAHLEQAKIGVGFVESKPFIKDRLNLGKTSKFSNLAKLWHVKDNQLDFSILLCSDVWYTLLSEAKRTALLDLHLCRCKPEYKPETTEVNGKKTAVKDEFGRIQYTNEFKTDDEGKIIWKLLPLDLVVFAENARRYGLWCEDMLNFGEVVKTISSNCSEQPSQKEFTI